MACVCRGQPVVARQGGQSAQERGERGGHRVRHDDCAEDGGQGHPHPAAQEHLAAPHPGSRPRPQCGPGGAGLPRLQNPLSRHQGACRH